MNATIVGDFNWKSTRLGIIHNTILWSQSKRAAAVRCTLYLVLNTVRHRQLYPAALPYDAYYYVRVPAVNASENCTQ